MCTYYGTRLFVKPSLYFYLNVTLSSIKFSHIQKYNRDFSSCLQKKFR